MLIKNIRYIIFVILKFNNCLIIISITIKNSLYLFFSWIYLLSQHITLSNTFIFSFILSSSILYFIRHKSFSDHNVINIAINRSSSLSKTRGRICSFLSLPFFFQLDAHVYLISNPDQSPSQLPTENDQSRRPSFLTFTVNPGAWFITPQRRSFLIPVFAVELRVRSDEKGVHNQTEVNWSEHLP